MIQKRHSVAGNIMHSLARPARMQHVLGKSLFGLFAVSIAGASGVHLMSGSRPVPATTTASESEPMPLPMHSALREVFPEPQLQPVEQFLGISAVPSVEELAEPPVAVTIARKVRHSSYAAKKSSALIPDSGSYVARSPVRLTATEIVIDGTKPPPEPTSMGSAKGPRVVVPSSSPTPFRRQAVPDEPMALAAISRAGEPVGSIPAAAQALATDPAPTIVPVAAKIEKEAAAAVGSIEPRMSEVVAQETIAQPQAVQVVQTAALPTIDRPLPPDASVALIDSLVDQPRAGVSQAVAHGGGEHTHPVLRIRLQASAADDQLASSPQPRVPGLANGDSDEVVIVVAHGIAPTFDPQPIDPLPMLAISDQREDVSVVSTESFGGYTDFALMDLEGEAASTYAGMVDEEGADSSFALAKVPQLPLWAVMDLENNRLVP